MKTKTTIIHRVALFLIATFATLSGHAQQFEDALYIYRNDGPINAFVYAEIDSITLSHYDADSVYHAEIVSQVFHAPDTAFVIPIAAIDSVSFVQPEVKMKNVWQGNDICCYWDDKPLYIIGADNGNTLRFHYASDESLLPKVGDPIIFNGANVNYLVKMYDEYERINTHLDPVYGKVSKVEKAEREYVVTTEPFTDLSGIFDQLIGVELTPGFARGDDAAYAQAYPADSPGPRKAKGSFSNDFNFSCSLGIDSISSTKGWTLNSSVNVGGSFSMKVVYEITSKRKHVGVEVKPMFQLSASLGAKMQFGDGDPIKPDWIQPGVTVPFPSFLPIFRFSTSFYPFAKIEGSLDFNLNLSLPETGFRLSFGYDDGKFPGSLEFCMGETPRPAANARFSFNGSLMLGFGAEFKLGTVDWLNLFDAKTEVRVGPKLSLDAGLDLVNTENTGSTVTTNLYDALKDTKLGLCLASEIDVKGKTAMSSHEYTFASFAREDFSVERYLFPEFTKPEVEIIAPAKYAFKYQPSRDPIFSTKLGFAIFDEAGNLISKHVRGYGTTYSGEEAWKEVNKDKLYHSNYDSGQPDEYAAYIPKHLGPMKVAPYFELFGLSFWPREMADVNFGGCPDHNHPHMIDLGTGSKWPCCNNGDQTNLPGGSWGLNESGQGFSYDQDPPVTDIAGTSWDIATQRWGAPWQMPKLEDVQALISGTEHINPTKSSWEGAIYNPKYYILAGNNNFIFLPVNKTYMTSTVNRAAFTVDSTTPIWSFDRDASGNYILNTSTDKITNTYTWVFPCAK